MLDGYVLKWVKILNFYFISLKIVLVVLLLDCLKVCVKLEQLEQSDLSVFSKSAEMAGFTFTTKDSADLNNDPIIHRPCYLIIE